MTSIRTSGTASSKKPRLEIDLLHGVTRDHEYYNRLPTGEYPAHIPVKPPVRLPWAKRLLLTAGIIGAIGAEEPRTQTSVENVPADYETTNSHRTQEQNNTENPYVITLFHKETAFDATKRVTDSLYTIGKLSETQAQFLQRTVPYALAMEERYGVPAEAALAKAAVESRDGASELARKDHNLFGIKYDTTYKRDYPGRVQYTTWEYTEDNKIRAWFFRYGSERESIEHFARFLNERRERDGTLRYGTVIAQRQPIGFLSALAESKFSSDENELPKTIGKLRSLHLYDIVGEARRAKQERNRYERALREIGRQENTHP